LFEGGPTVQASGATGFEGGGLRVLRRGQAVPVSGTSAVHIVTPSRGRAPTVRFTAGRPEWVTTFPGDFTGMAGTGAGTLWLRSYGELRSFDGERTGESVRYHYARSNALGLAIGPQWVLDRFGDLGLRHAVRDSVGWLREPYRLRFMNISLGNDGLRARLLFNGSPVRTIQVETLGQGIATLP
jgi:hypothetical protein